MFTFGWSEIFLIGIIVVVVIGPKDLPKFIKQVGSLSKYIKKISTEFKSSLNEIADHEDFKDVKSSLNEVNKIKDDLDLKGKFKSEIKSIKETTNIIEKEVNDLKNLENEVNSTKEKSTLVEKDVRDKNKNKTQDEADLI